MTATQRNSQPWLIHFFRRVPSDDIDETVPAFAFFEAIPSKVAAEIHAVLEAVAHSPPPAYSGGGKWVAMYGDMAGFYEIRAQAGRMNYRLFCLLMRDAEDLGGSSIVCLGGLSKPRRQAADSKDYRKIIEYRAEFNRHRGILK